MRKQLVYKGGDQIKRIRIKMKEHIKIGKIKGVKMNKKQLTIIPRFPLQPCGHDCNMTIYP